VSPAKKRRQYGSGGIIQRHVPGVCPPVDTDTRARPDHTCTGLWIGRVYTGRWTAGGDRERLTVSGKSRAIVEGKLRKLTREIADKGAPAVGARSVTVKAWSDEWLPRHAKKVRPTTFTTDAGAVRKWIIPTLGHRRLADLNPGDFRVLRDAVTKPDPPRYPNGRSTTTALHAHKTLTTMLKAAKVEGHIVDDRLLYVDKPGKAQNDRTSMPADAATRVLAVLDQHADASRWVSALLQGMRSGESRGLTWDCIDFQKKRLDVSWQLQELQYLDRDADTFQVPDGFECRRLINSFHLTRPKTSHGLRVIPLVPWMEAALRLEREKWVENEWGLVWTDVLQDGVTRRPIRPEDDRARWHAIQAEAGVAHPSGRPYHVHELRHTTATLLLEAGVDRRVIEAIVGHATLVESYLHVGDSQARAALEKVADRLGLTQP
jgi:integrase